MTPMTEVGGLPQDITTTIDAHAMNTGTDLNSVALDLNPVTTAIGVVVTMILIEVAPGHFTDLPIITSHATEAPVPTNTIVIHPTADPHLTGTLPGMTADPAIGPGNISTNQTKDIHPLHGHRPGNTRTEDTNKSQSTTHHQNTIARTTMTATPMRV